MEAWHEHCGETSRSKSEDWKIGSSQANKLDSLIASKCGSWEALKRGR